MVIWKKRKVSKYKARRQNLLATKEDQAFTLLPTCKTRPTLHKGGKLQTYIKKEELNSTSDKATMLVLQEHLTHMKLKKETL